MIFNLSDPIDLSRLDARLEQCKRLGKSVELTVKEKPKSASSNNYAHLLMTWFAIEHGMKLEEVKKEIFKKLCNPDIFIIEIEVKFIGKTKVLRSMADISQPETTMSIARFRKFSSEQGTYLPEPHEREWLAHIAREELKHKQYLY